MNLPLFTSSEHCLGGHHCVTCRATDEYGERFRADKAKNWAVPADWPACPHGKPMGFEWPDDAAERKAANPAPSKYACTHRGGRVGDDHCKPCGGKLHLDVYACGLHRRCTIDRTGQKGHKVCGLCIDRTSATKPPVHRSPGGHPLKTWSHTVPLVHAGEMPVAVATPLAKVVERVTVGATGLAGFFDRVVCVNLDRRADRWGRFAERLKAGGWPFKWPERFSAIDGQRCPPPPWWTQGAGAWGCFMSHLAIIQDCLNAGTRSVLVIEDDAVPIDGFAPKVSAFIASVPQDWQHIYLGGQHLKAHRGEVSPGVVVPQNVNRTHAYALNREGMKIAYRHLCGFVEHAKRPDHHVDHRFGVLHESGQIKAYAPTAWLVGQAAGPSNVGNGNAMDRFWGGQDGAARKLAKVAVIGPNRSGTSVTAGILHRLGVYLGRRFMEPNRHNPDGYYEAVWLQERCRKWISEPHGTIKPQEHGERVTTLRKWINDAMRDAPLNATAVGAKSPAFCLFGDDLVEAWGGDTKIINVVRPFDEAASSLDKAGWFGGNGREFLRKLYDGRDRFMDGRDCLTVRYADLLADPAGTVRRMIDYISIKPTDEQVAAAVKLVRPKKVEAPAIIPPTKPRRSFSFGPHHHLGDALAICVSLEAAAKANGVERVGVGPTATFRGVCEAFSFDRVEFDPSPSESAVREYRAAPWRAPWISRMLGGFGRMLGGRVPARWVVPDHRCGSVGERGDTIYFQFDGRAAGAWDRATIDRILNIYKGERLVAIGGLDTPKYVGDDYPYELGEIPFLCHRLLEAKHFLGIDSGITHLAGLLKTPTHVYRSPLRYLRPVRTRFSDYPTVIPCKIPGE